MTWIRHSEDGEEVIHRAPKKAKQPAPESPPQPEAQKPRKIDITPLEATLILAKRGRREILPKLREVLNKDPELWRTYGNLTLQAQESWIRLIAGKDLLLAESLRRHLDQRRSELAGANASPLERLLADRLLACEIQVLYFDAHEGEHPGGQNAKLDEYRLKRQDQAQRQLIAAAKALAAVRQVVSRTVILGVIHQPAVAPIAPIIAGPVNADQPAKGNGHDERATGKAINGTAKPVNGHRLNGHNRLAHLLGATPAGESV
jgi:hypothetical protein